MALPPLVDDAALLANLTRFLSVANNDNLSADKLSQEIDMFTKELSAEASSQTPTTPTPSTSSHAKNIQTNEPSKDSPLSLDLGLEMGEEEDSSIEESEKLLASVEAIIRKGEEELKVKQSEKEAKPPTSATTPSTAPSNQTQTSIKTPSQPQPPSSPSPSPPPDKPQIKSQASTAKQHTATKSTPLSSDKEKKAASAAKTKQKAVSPKSSPVPTKGQPKKTLASGEQNLNQTAGVHQAASSTPKIVTTSHSHAAPAAASKPKTGSDASSSSNVSLSKKTTASPTVAAPAPAVKNASTEVAPKNNAASRANEKEVFSQITKLLEEETKKEKQLEKALAEKEKAAEKDRGQKKQTAPTTQSPLPSPAKSSTPVRDSINNNIPQIPAGTMTANLTHTDPKTSTTDQTTPIAAPSSSPSTSLAALSPQEAPQSTVSAVRVSSNSLSEQSSQSKDSLKSNQRSSQTTDVESSLHTTSNAERRSTLSVNSSPSNSVNSPRGTNVTRPRFAKQSASSVHVGQMVDHRGHDTSDFSPSDSTESELDDTTEGSTLHSAWSPSQGASLIIFVLSLALLKRLHTSWGLVKRQHSSQGQLSLLILAVKLTISQLLDAKRQPLFPTIQPDTPNGSLPLNNLTGGRKRAKRTALGDGARLDEEIELDDRLRISRSNSGELDEEERARTQKLLSSASSSPTNASSLLNGNNSVRRSDLEMQSITSMVHTPKMINVVPNATTLLTQSSLNNLLPWFPSVTALKDASLVYSSSIHGYSLNSLYRLVSDLNDSDANEMLLVLRDEHGNVFGTFTSHPWIVNENVGESYFGDARTFVFSIQPTFQVYQATQNNTFFMLAKKDQIALGGGDNFALWLDSSLKTGSSKPCATFDSPTLSTHAEFLCVEIELWAFMH